MDPMFCKDCEHFFGKKEMELNCSNCGSDNIVGLEEAEP